MKKIFAVSAVCCILLFACAPFSFATSTNLAYPMNCPEPSASYNTLYFAHRYNNNTFPVYLYTFSVMGIPEEAWNQGKFTFVIDIDTSIKIKFYNYTSLNYSVYCCTYNPVNNQTTFVSGQNWSEYTVADTTSDTSGIYYSGNCQVNANHAYLQANLIWNGEFDYINQLNSILTKLNSISTSLSDLYIDIDAVYDEVHDIDFYIRDIDGYLTSTFAQAFNAFYARNHNDLTTLLASVSNVRAELLLIESKIDTANTNLSQIRSYLYEIKNLLGSGETITTIPPDNQLSNEVSDYAAEESQYFDDFDDGLDQLDNQIDFIENIFDDFTDAFTFIKHTFDEFVNPYGYIILTISLIFGIIVMVLGRNA